MANLQIRGCCLFFFILWSAVQLIDAKAQNTCPTGYYGILCDRRCYCENAEPCLSSGYCLTGCQPGYVGNVCAQDGTPMIDSFSYEEKVNSNSTTILMCASVGNPIPDLSSIVVYDSNSTAVKRIGYSTIKRLYKIEIRHEVIVTESGENFTCVLTNSDGLTTQERRFTVDVYTPPSLTIAPFIDPLTITSSSVQVSWIQWNTFMEGDGPIEHYLLQYRQSSSNLYTHSIKVEPTVTAVDVTYFQDVTGLYWDTDYDFVVVAVRPGEGGEGQPSPKTNVTTKCDVPTEAAIITYVRAMNSTTLLVHWNLPPSITWQCKNLHDIRVTWKKSTSATYLDEHFQLVSPRSTSTFISRLESCVTYDVQVQLRNSDTLTGPLSKDVNGTTLTSDIVIDEVNTSSISLRWRMPECALPITKELLFWYQAENELKAAASIVQNVQGTVEYLQIHHLQAGQKYLITMQITTTDDNMLEIGIIEISTLREDCFAEMLTLSWPKTKAGETAISLETCPEYSAKVGVPRGSRVCEVGDDSQPIWYEPIIVDCFEDNTMTITDQLEMIAKNSVDDGNVEEVASDLAILSDNSDIISKDGLEAIAKTLENIANVQESSDQVTASVIETVDNALDIDNDEFLQAMSTKAPTRILKSLESQISNQQQQDGNFSYTGRNIDIKAVHVQQDTLQHGLGYALITDDQVQEDIYDDGKAGQIYYNTSSIPVDEADAAIALPELSFSNVGSNNTMPDVPVSFVIYQNSKLFQSNRLLAESTCTARKERVVGTRIIAATIEGTRVSNLPTHHQVMNAFLPLEAWEAGTLDNFECVFWDFELDEGRGDWSSEGCSLIMTTSTNRSICNCDHLTSFAVLMDFRGQAQSSLVLSLISTIGCGISIATLSITVGTYLSMRSLRTSTPSRILICLSVSLLCLYIVFLVGIDQTQSVEGCITVAVLLHYFTLASVCWMAVEAVNLYLLVVKVFNVRVANFILKASCFAWGVPLVIVGIVLAVDYLQYCNAKHCFMQVGYAFYFADLLPIFLVLVFNFVVFALVIQKLTCRRTVFKKAQKSSGQAVRKQTLNRAINALAISGLLGLTWIFGFFTIIDAFNIAFQILFTVCNSFQGLFIFLLFCVRQKEVREAWGRCFGSTRKKEFVNSRVEMSNNSRFTTHKTR